MQYKKGREERRWFREGSRVRGNVLVLTGVVLAEWMILFEEPGAGLGLYLLLLGLLAWLGRRGEEARVGAWLATGLLVMSGLQALRWTSFSNVVVLLVLVVVVNGVVRHGGLGSVWCSWVEGGLVFLRPLGVLLRYRESGANIDESGAPLVRRVGRVVSLLWPAMVLLLVFGLLLTGGNAVMGKWAQDAIGWLERVFVFAGSLPTPEQIVAWGFFGWIGMALVFGAKATRVTEWLIRPWREFGVKDQLNRGYQWVAILVAMNLLFMISTIADVIYLWMSRELPEGITHSRYLHQGVGALILTTLLSAAVLGMLTQHGRMIRKSRCICWLSMGWIVQNLLLISGVFLRVWMYVDAYAFTPRRIYVVLFLNLVIWGFVLLSWALMRSHNLKWLLGANLILLFSHFFLLQFVDVPGLVAAWNGHLYQAGKLDFPEEKYLWQIGSHAVPYLVLIGEYPQNEEDRSRALAELIQQEPAMMRIENRPWQSFQNRDYQNWKAWRQFTEHYGSHSSQTSPAGGTPPPEEYP